MKYSGKLLMFCSTGRVDKNIEYAKYQVIDEHKTKVTKQLMTNLHMLFNDKGCADKTPLCMVIQLPIKLWVGGKELVGRRKCASGET